MKKCNNGSTKSETSPKGLIETIVQGKIKAIASFSIPHTKKLLVIINVHVQMLHIAPRFGLKKKSIENVPYNRSQNILRLQKKREKKRRKNLFPAPLSLKFNVAS